MIINKFIQDLAKGNKKKQQVIQQEVDKFFKTEKITEASLKELKTKVQNAVAGKLSSTKNEDDRNRAHDAPKPDQSQVKDSQVIAQ